MLYINIFNCIFISSKKKCPIVLFTHDFITGIININKLIEEMSSMILLSMTYNFESIHVSLLQIIMDIDLIETAVAWRVVIRSNTIAADRHTNDKK